MKKQIFIPESEFFNSETNEFFTVKAQTLTIKHTLVSVSKWEAKWKKPFLTKEPKTREESLDYIKCMTLTQNVDPNVYYAIPNNVINEIQQYIDDPMTATTINNKSNKKGRGNPITSELIYYWMTAYSIPWEAEKWHLNRLLTLIEICNIKNAPSKKMSKREIYSQNQALNAARRKAAHSNG